MRNKVEERIFSLTILVRDLRTSISFNRDEFELTFALCRETRGLELIYPLESSFQDDERGFVKRNTVGVFKLVLDGIEQNQLLDFIFKSSINKERITRLTRGDMLDPVFKDIIGQNKWNLWLEENVDKFIQVFTDSESYYLGCLMSDEIDRYDISLSKDRRFVVFRNIFDEVVYKFETCMGYKIDYETCHESLSILDSLREYKIPYRNSIVSLEVSLRDNSEIDVIQLGHCERFAFIPKDLIKYCNECEKKLIVGVPKNEMKHAIGGGGKNIHKVSSRYGIKRLSFKAFDEK
jgi:hypothetical protein